MPSIDFDNQNETSCDIIQCDVSDHVTTSHILVVTKKILLEVTCAGFGNVIDSFHVHKDIDDNSLYYNER